MGSKIIINIVAIISCSVALVFHIINHNMIWSIILSILLIANIAIVAWVNMRLQKNKK